MGLMQNSKAVSSLFGGTKDKCVGCEKTVYPIEKVKLIFQMFIYIK